MKLCYTALALVALLLSPAGTTALPQNKALPPALADKTFKPKVKAHSDAGGLIVGGKEAEPGRYPYMVNLNGGFGDNYCGGSLIAPNVVLTAAHCQGASEVTIGRFNIDNAGESYERISVAQEVRHPGYDDWTLENDIMLIRLSRASTKPTVAINWDGSANVDQMLSVMGWGTTSEGGFQPDKLRYVDVPYISNSKCNQAYGGGITNDMMCAGYDQGGKDSCQGDSGGPIIISGGAAGRDIQVGVVSWGIGCAQAGYPGVYSRISESWSDFLQNQLRSWNVDITNPSPGPSPGPSPSPSPSPPPVDCFECKDDPNYLFKGRNGKNCDWVGKNAARHCRKGANVIGCPATCGVC